VITSPDPIQLNWSAKWPCHLMHIGQWTGQVELSWIGSDDVITAVNVDAEHRDEMKDAVVKHFKYGTFALKLLVL